MVQSTRTSIVFQTFTRILLLIGVLIVASLTSFPFYNFIHDTLGYAASLGSFDFSLGDWEFAWALSIIFWVCMIFGTLGKKIDYIFIIIFLALGILEYSYPNPVTPQMYLGLVGVAALGNALGYIAKLARQNWLTKQR